MTSHFTLVWLLFVTGVGLLPAQLAGQPNEDEDRMVILPPMSGFSVRDTNEISTLEQLKIVARRALAPRSLPDVAPLQAYADTLACTESRLLTNTSLTSTRYGPAALVVEVGPNDYVAFYFRTPYEAIRTAQEGRWCEQAARPWFIATTYPIDGYEPVRRFLSMEADRIAAQLRER